LGGQCLIADCQGRREITAPEGVPVLSGPAGEENTSSLQVDRLLCSAAEVFGDGVTLVFLSGVEQEVKNGMETVVIKGGKIILQEPDSCLLPGSIEAIRSFGMEECCLKPEEIAPYLAEDT
jgi:two-component system chemotaxis response regulator CheB